MWGAMWDWLNSSPDCEIFYKNGSSYEVDGGRVRVRGEGSVGELTFDVRDDREKVISTTLTVMPRAKLNDDPRVEFAETRRTQSLISDWTILTTDLDESIVFSDDDPLAFIFQNKDQFTLRHLRGDFNPLRRLKYFQELAIITKIQEKGYSSDIVQRGRRESPAAFANFMNNLHDAESSLEVLSLEQILRIEQREITYPPADVDKCIKICKGWHHFGAKLGGEDGWAAKVEEEFGESKIFLHRGDQIARGKFTTKTYHEAYAQQSARMIPNKLLHTWYIDKQVKNNKKYLYYLCPELEELLQLEADLDFPVDALDASAVTHQFYYELALEAFMEINGTTIQDALQRPGWTENKLQTLATYLEYVEKWIDQGITFQYLEDMEENKFCYMLQKYWTVQDALKFASLHEILGCEAALCNNEDAQQSSRCTIL